MRRSHRGAALLALLALLILAGTGWWLVAPAGQQVGAAAHDAAVLAQAKAALLAWSALHCPAAATAGEALRVRSGELPVPDRDAPGDDGFGTQDATSPSLGRLPWKTLGLPPLRDASGEYLWYALADRYRDSGTGALPPVCDESLPLADPHGRPIAPSPGDCIVAVVMAPGAPLPTQLRNDTQSAAQYLERDTVDGIVFDNTRRGGPFLQGPRWRGGQPVLNDRIAWISWHEIRRSAAALPCRAGH
ncbi:hypothetical protein N8I74_18375 [Chitiniphilus purpureus]|uniref:Uncharacterized protein n=1 Tax=Chitiniphilus purpureus TaxID=2981137 RepID=A0ABY6DLM2_9NEIS|nr:hypothetical protein [Chitiniphilus sp. CD1]UXY15254.1 hypothetical protein N8I74_18375 [Chitiniphilus sp. CD1]